MAQPKSFQKEMRENHMKTAQSQRDTERRVSFAMQKGQTALLYRPAPLWVLEAFTRLTQEAFVTFPLPPDENRTLGSLKMPAAGPGDFVLAGA